MAVLGLRASLAQIREVLLLGKWGGNFQSNLAQDPNLATECHNFLSSFLLFALFSDVY